MLEEEYEIHLLEESSIRTLYNTRLCNYLKGITGIQAQPWIAIAKPDR